MAGLTRTVHPRSSCDWGPVDKFAPDLHIRGDQNGEPTIPPALCMLDPDGEMHVFVFSEEGRKALIGKLTGGIMVVPGGKG